MLVCELPRLKQGEQRLQVSRNGVDIAPAHVLLHVHGGFIARSIKPALGMGGVTVVTIAGAGFAPALSWGCRFGSITVGGAVGQVLQATGPARRTPTKTPQKTTVP